MAGRKSDFTLTRLDDLFTTQEQRDDEDRKSTRLNSSHIEESRMPSSA